MKLTLKLALLSAILGASGFVSAQTTPPAAQANAELDKCHADVAKDVAKFKADVAEAKKSHAVAPNALKRLAQREANILVHEKALKHETLANCQAEHKRLQANDALLLRDIAFGKCHQAVHADVLAFKKELATAKKEHTLTAPAIKRISLREAAILKHEADLAKHETLANCQAEDKALKANLALLVRDVNFGKCHHGITLQHRKINADIRAGLANKSLSPAKIAEVKKAEAEIIKHERELGKKETLAQCEEVKGQMTALEKTIAPHLK